MSDGPAPQDQGAQNFARGVGQGQPADTTKPAQSMQELIDQLIEHTGSWISKTTGVKVSSFFNVNMFGGTKLEDAAIRTGKSIIESSLVQGPQGGALAGAASIFKWWGGESPSAPPIEAASGGDSGASSGSGGSSGDSGHSFESYVSSSPGMGEMFIAAGGGNHFEWRNASESILGTISPPNVGDASYSRGEGMGM